MEENLVESTPLVQPFYYFENVYSNSINFKLLEDDLRNIMDNYVLPKKFTRNITEHGSGLSFIGKKFIRYCGIFPNFCDSYESHISHIYIRINVVISVQPIAHGQKEFFLTLVILIIVIVLILIDFHSSVILISIVKLYINY